CMTGGQPALSIMVRQPPRSRTTRSVAAHRERKLYPRPRRACGELDAGTPRAQAHAWAHGWTSAPESHRIAREFDAGSLARRQIGYTGPAIRCSTVVVDRILLGRFTR